MTRPPTRDEKRLTIAIWACNFIALLPGTVLVCLPSEPSATGRFFACAFYPWALCNLIAIAYFVRARRLEGVRADAEFFDKHCYICGFDLTGNLSGRCPECGNRWADAEG